MTADTETGPFSVSLVVACGSSGSSVGEFTARALILACGRLTEPRIPDVPGLDTFRGPLFHSARWDHDAELRDKVARKFSQYLKK